jgi:hypothetical protein
MNDVIKYLAALPFTQLMVLIVTVFIMVMALIMVIAKFAKIAGVEKISTKGIEFDTDGKPVKKPSRFARRRVAKK